MVLVDSLTGFGLLNYWPDSTLANPYFLVKITHLMDAAGGRMGAEAGRTTGAEISRSSDSGGRTPWAARVPLDPLLARRNRSLPLADFPGRPGFRSHFYFTHIMCYT